MRHGTSSTYSRGCRCAPCRAARSAYGKEYRTRTGYSAAKKVWLHACRRLAHALVEGDLVLEVVVKGELRFRYVKEPKTGLVIRRGKSAYAAIVEKKDWPVEVPLLRSVA